jgi:hypothetical protein
MDEKKLAETLCGRLYKRRVTPHDELLARAACQG